MTTDTLDPVTLAVLRGRLEQVADEMDATLYRSAFNPIIAKAMAPTNTGRPDLPCTSVSPLVASYRPWQASCASAMMGLKALR